MINTLMEKLAIREFWMFTVAGVSLIIIAVIAAGLIRYGVPKNAEALLGTIVGGLLMLSRDAVNAIRALWRVSEERIEKETV